MAFALTTIAAVVTIAVGGARAERHVAAPGASETAIVQRWSETLPTFMGEGFAARASRRFLLLSDLPNVEADRTLERLERTADAVETFAQAIGVASAAVAGERLLSIAFSDQEAFERFARESDRIDARWMVGYWMPGADRTVFRRGPSATGRAKASRGALATAGGEDAATVAHEAAHQLLHRLGVQRRSLQSPLALSEGLAVAFEPCAEANGRAFDDQPERRARLRARRDALPSLWLLVASPRLPSRDARDVELFYDASWSLVRHLWRTRPAAFSRYLRSMRERAADLSPALSRELFEAHFGSLGTVERAWRRAEGL